MKLKKIIPLLLITILAGCSKKNADELTIISPTGAPAVAFYNYATNENYTTNGTPANILSGMTQNGNDIVVIDTLSGLNAIKDADAPYQILATITFGNFYLVGTGNDDDQKMRMIRLFYLVKIKLLINYLSFYTLILQILLM